MAVRLPLLLTGNRLDGPAAVAGCSERRELLRTVNSVAVGERKLAVNMLSESRPPRSRSRPVQISDRALKLGTARAAVAGTTDDCPPSARWPINATAEAARP
jgi:hypothetical protein